MAKRSATQDDPTTTTKRARVDVDSHGVSIHHVLLSHLFDAIYASASRDVLLAFRATSKALRDRVDATLAYHIVVEGSFPTGITSPSGRLPAVAPMKKRVVSKAQWLRGVSVLDYVTGMTATQFEKFAAMLDPALSVMRIHEGGKRHINPPYPSLPLRPRTSVIFTVTTATCWRRAYLPPCERVVINIAHSRAWNDWSEKWLQFTIPRNVQELVIVFDTSRKRVHESTPSPVPARWGILAPILALVAESPPAKLTIVGLPNIPLPKLGLHEIGNSHNIEMRLIEKLVAEVKNPTIRDGRRGTDAEAQALSETRFMSLKEYAQVSPDFAAETQSGVQIVPSAPKWNPYVLCGPGQSPDELIRKFYPDKARC